MDDVTAHVRDDCAQEHAAVAERCGAAREARQAYDASVEHGREIRRRLTAARHALEAATEAADPRRRQELKDQALAAFKGERATASDDAARAEAAARWARAVDAINRETRVAARALTQAKRVVASLEADLRGADAREQSLRVTAEAAEAACLEARVRLAACEERSLAPQVAAAPDGAGSVGAVASAGAPVPSAASAGGAPLAGVPAPGGAPQGAVAVASAPRGAAPPLGVVPPGGPAPPPGPRPGTLPRIGQGTPTVIEALLMGDRFVMERTASALAETIGRPAPEVFARLRELLEACVATAASRGYVVVDPAHEFWSRLTADEARDVLAALARLGFQVEPGQGWLADRAPVQSDLAMALAYAGLDARSLRYQPSNAQLRELPRSVAVDTRALLLDDAPDLALDHVVRMLEQRADPLGPLWDGWGYVRPLLLSDPRSLP